ncbi:MAG: hypothetical protein AB7N80_00820 [Bdellovibrionales bacterium]
MRFLGLLLTVFMLSACSKTEWAVRWADTYISWKLIDQFEFSGAAKKTVRLEAERLVKLVRQKKFTQVGSFLHETARLSRSVDWRDETRLRGIIHERLLTAEQFFYSLFELVGPETNKIASLVAADNWQKFKKNFEKENGKILSEKSKCHKRFYDQIEIWMGEISEAQKNQVQIYCAKRIGSAKVRVDNRRQLLNTLDGWAASSSDGFSPNRFITAVVRWMNEYRRLQSPEALASWREGQGVLTQVLVQVLRLSTTRQKVALAENLEKQSAIFKKMAIIH